MPTTDTDTALAEMSEAEVQIALVKEAAEIPWLRLWRNNIGKARNPSGKMYHFGLPPGSPDFVGVYKGMFLGVEVKKFGGKRTKQQKEFALMLAKMGGLYIKFTPSWIGKFEDRLDDLYREYLWRIVRYNLKKGGIHDRRDGNSAEAAEAPRSADKG